ncbi:YdeI family protein [Nanoarchaeota archaeon]
MKIGKTLYVIDRKKWRTWLSKNHSKAKEIWLIYYRKSSKKTRIPYNDAVEEALCYGWIDSIVKKIDEEKFVQRFTPRKSSKISVMNKERVRRLIKQKKMTKYGLEAIELKEKRFKIKKDIIKTFKENKEAWKNFQKFPAYYKRIRIGYIEMQRKHSKDMFNKALRYLIKKSEQNKRFGMIK